MLIEKVIKALSLLEHLKLEGLQFVFKGGTSLLLVIPEPRRFSIDIDLVLEAKPNDLTEVFDRVVRRGVFTAWEQNVRASNPEVPKEHYKFTYVSSNPANKFGNNILLDLLFEKSHHAAIKSLPIVSTFVDQDGAPTEVLVPTATALLADKLTAFAPTTVGIRYGLEKQVEIIKQMFDVANLLDHVDDLDVARRTFAATVPAEAKYRKAGHTVENVLDDVVEASMTIISRGEHDPYGGWEELSAGIKRLASFVIGGSYHLEAAIPHAARAIYATRLIRDTTATMAPKFAPAIDLSGVELEIPRLPKAQKLRKSHPEAFYYLWHALGEKKARII